MTGNRPRKRQQAISLLEVRRAAVGAREERITLVTDQGDISGLYHPLLPDGAPGPAAVVWVGGAHGGLHGPADGLYPDLAARLLQYGISSLRLDYRQPNHLEACVLDTLVGLAWLADGGVTRAALVGHSFGGAVVITAGALNPLVALTVALSPQTYGAELVDQISPRATLFVHGTTDTVLPMQCSLQLYALAGEPKELILYPGAGHGLREVHDEVRDLLEDRIARALTPGVAQAPSSLSPER